jgi:exosortase/archaeosortase family protein
VLTDTARSPTLAGKFVVRGVAFSLGLFGVFRLPWTELHILTPLIRAQSALAVRLLGAPALPIETTLACSGADAMALCFGAILAYPATWRARLTIVTGGAALILGLNTLRIGTLGRAVASPGWFNALHIYVWPAVLTLAIGGYVFAWMRTAEAPSPTPRPQASAAAPRLLPTRRFVLFSAAFLLAFVAASPLYLGSAAVLALAAFIAQAAAWTLDVAGIGAHASGNVLWTPRGGFLVTQECISTPLIPVYLAAACTYATTWRRLALGVLATLPLFTALGIVRLLVVALPDVVSPLFFVHAFYQLLAGAVIVWLAALWRHGRREAVGPALAGIVAGAVFVGVIGPLFDRVIAFPAGAPIDDPQGAIAFLPGFQAGLYLALWTAAFVAVGWTRFLAGLAILGLSETAGLMTLHVLHTHTGLAAHVRDVRGWAIVGPVLIFAAVINRARPDH